MKIPSHLPSTIWLIAAGAALLYAFQQAGSSGIVLIDAPLRTRAWLLCAVYVRPGLLAFAGTTLLQLQFRMPPDGRPAGVSFGMSLLASLVLLQALRNAAAMPQSAPAYAIGMALSYTMLARLYAVRMRTVWRGVRLPWIVWRGNRAAVAEVERQIGQMRARQGQ